MSPATNPVVGNEPAEEEVWRPQAGPQFSLVQCNHQEVFFGGARGGGKTDGVLGKWAIKEKRYGKHFNAIMFRRTTTSAEDAIERSKEIYGPLGGKFNEAKLRWRMPNGGRVSFAYLENVKDAEAYQGRNVTDAWVEEAGQFATSTPIMRLFGVLRSAKGVPVQLISDCQPWRRRAALDQGAIQALPVSARPEGSPGHAGERRDAPHRGHPEPHREQPLPRPGLRQPPAHGRQRAAGESLAEGRLDRD